MVIKAAGFRTKFCSLLHIRKVEQVLSSR